MDPFEFGQAVAGALRALGYEVLVEQNVSSRIPGRNIPLIYPNVRLRVTSPTGSREYISFTSALPRLSPQAVASEVDYRLSMMGPSVEVVPPPTWPAPTPVVVSEPVVTPVTTTIDRTQNFSTAGEARASLFSKPATAEPTPAAVPMEVQPMPIYPRSTLGGMSRQSFAVSGFNGGYGVNGYGGWPGVIQTGLELVRPFLPQPGAPVQLPGQFPTGPDITQVGIPRIPLPGVGGIIPRVGGWVGRAARGPAGRFLKIFGVLTAAGLTADQISMLFASGAIQLPPKRKRGISAAELRGFRRITSLLCSIGMVPARRRRSRKCSSKK